MPRRESFLFSRGEALLKHYVFLDKGQVGLSARLMVLILAQAQHVCRNRKKHKALALIPE